MAPRINREILRIAEKEGLSKPHIIGGDPHGRLIGGYNGKQLSISVTLTKKPGSVGRHAQYVKQNIRHAMRAADMGVPYWGYKG